MADTDSERLEGHGRKYGLRAAREEETARGSGDDMADADSGRLEVERRSERVGIEDREHERRNEPDRRGAFPPGPNAAEGWRRWIEEGRPQPGICRGSDGARSGQGHSRDRVDQLRLLGNGVVPQQAALAFRILAERLTE